MEVLASPDTLTLDITLEGRGSFSARGSGDVVLRALDVFREEIATTLAAAPRPKTEPLGSPPPGAIEVGAAPTVDLPPLPPYLKVKAPRTNPEAVAVMAVWDQRKNGTSEFTTTTLDGLYKRSGRKPAGNLGRDILAASSAGWLDKAGRGKYQLTRYGEEFVDSLPRAKE